MGFSTSNVIYYVVEQNESSFVEVMPLLLNNDDFKIVPKMRMIQGCTMVFALSNVLSLLLKGSSELKVNLVISNFSLGL